MATKAYELYGKPLPPENPGQEFMTVQETAYVLRCSVSWLRRFLRDNPHLHSRNGNRGRIVTNRADREAINDARRAGTRRRRRPAARRANRAATAA